MNQLKDDLKTLGNNKKNSLALSRGRAIYGSVMNEFLKDSNQTLPCGKVVNQYFMSGKLFQMHHKICKVCCKHEFSPKIEDVS